MSDPHQLFAEHFASYDEYKCCTLAEFCLEETDYFRELIHFMFYHRLWTKEEIARYFHRDYRVIESLIRAHHLCHPIYAQSYQRQPN